MHNNWCILVVWRAQPSLAIASILTRLQDDE
jgi:hypothetical protein